MCELLKERSLERVVSQVFHPNLKKKKAVLGIAERKGKEGKKEKNHFIRRHAAREELAVEDGEVSHRAHSKKGIDHENEGN